MPYTPLEIIETFNFDSHFCRWLIVLPANNHTEKKKITSPTYSTSFFLNASYFFIFLSEITGLTGKHSQWTVSKIHGLSTMTLLEHKWRSDWESAARFLNKWNCHLLSHFKTVLQINAWRFHLFLKMSFLKELHLKSVPLNSFDYYSHFTNYLITAIYLHLSHSDTHRCIRPHIHPHKPPFWLMCQMVVKKSPTPCLVQTLFSNVCYFFSSISMYFCESFDQSLI